MVYTIHTVHAQKLGLLVEEVFWVQGQAIAGYCLARVYLRTFKSLIFFLLCQKEFGLRFRCHTLASYAPYLVYRHFSLASRAF